MTVRTGLARGHRLWLPFVLLSVCALVVVGHLFDFGRTAALGAGEKKPALRNDAPQVDTLPVRRVVLFSSGVGYFEHEGTVEGDADVVFHFRIDDVNDLLKSLIVQDLDGGQVTAVSYTSRDPITRTLRSFAIDLTNNPSLYGLLEQLRGEPVRLHADEAITGTVLGVEKKRRLVVDSDVVEEYEFVNLLTDTGVRSVRLDQIQRIEVLNKRIARELAQALEVLATAHDTQKKTVVLRCRGKGKRRVRVGYVREVPVWKTTYRLALEGDRALLQGWAIVENTTDSDWQQVQMALVSGRPVSFRMDLYQPLYVERPTMKLAYDVPVKPRAYEAELERKEKGLADQRARGRVQELAGGGFGGAVRAMRREARAPAAVGTAGMGAPGNAIATDALASSVAVAAVGEEAGAQFRYLIKHPVELPRQQSALLPIVSAELSIERISIFNRQTHPKHPMRGLRFRNDTGAYLMKGPIAVFDEGVYAGDGLIDNTPQGHRRIVSFALDLDVEVAITARTRPSQAVTYRIVRGAFLRQTKLVRTTTYKIRNRGTSPRTLIIEHPAAQNWKLAEPTTFEERTRSVYRFKLKVPPEETLDLVVREEQPRSESIALRNWNLTQIELTIAAPEVPEKIKEALRKLADLQRQLTRHTMLTVQLEQELKRITLDQERIRENLARIDSASSLAKRYLQKLQQQESEIEKLQQQLREALAEKQKLQRAIDEFIANLTVE